MPIIKHICLILCVLLLAVTCKKQVPGPKGAPGKPGLNGNANQTTVSNFLILSQSWLTNNVKKDWNTDYPNDLLTNSVIENAAVNVYVQINGAWFPLPYTTQDFHLQYNLQPGVLHLNYFKSHQVANQPVSMNFRLVIVSQK